MTITAPFAFARIPRELWFPDWAELVSHDVPFKDGYCGSIELSFEVVTPLIVGGLRRKATAERAGEVWPFQLPDGTYAIPASSLQGMTRAILEVAAFGKLAPFVDDQRFGVRDISGSPTGKAVYGTRIAHKGQNVIHPRTKTGWLIRSPDHPLPRLIPCDLARIEHSEIVKLPLPNRAPHLLDVLARNGPFSHRSGEQASRDAPERYEALLGPRPHSKDGLNIEVTVEPAAPHEHSRGPIHYARCQAGGPTAGTLIVTGKPLGTQKGDGSRRLHTKHMEFVFHSPDRLSAASAEGGKLVPADVWRDFLTIHQPDTGSGKGPNPHWKYWEDDFLRGEPVPIFYLTDRRRLTSLGTAFMSKMAMPLSTHAMLRNSSESHLDARRPDLASLIFGATTRSQKSALKKRASFDMALATIPPELTAPVKARNPVALLKPKPNYYPIYVRQHPYMSQRIPHEQPYATYASFDGPEQAHRAPELAGVKIWPVTYDCYIPPVGDTPPTVLTDLNALPVGTRFDSVMLRVHNLRTLEVGGLLWAVTFGREEALAGRENALCHKLGMGKPFGLGTIRIKVKRLHLTPNEGGNVPTPQEFVTQFEEAMERVYRTLSGNDDLMWARSPQVLALLRCADPEAQDDELLKYLVGFAGYAASRRNNEYLPPYVTEDDEIAHRTDTSSEVPDQPTEGETLD